jgi:hypothetical protein
MMLFFQKKFFFVQSVEALVGGHQFGWQSFGILANNYNKRPSATTYLSL